MRSLTFGSFVLLAFWMSVKFPLVALGIFPIFFGIPHLVPSVKLSMRNVFQNSRRFLIFLLMIWVLVFGFRYYFSYSPSTTYHLYPELIGVGLLSIFLYFHHKRMNGILIWLLMTVVLIKWPSESAKVLLIGHSAIGFLYWFLLARSKQALISSGVYLFTNAVIFLSPLAEDKFITAYAFGQMMHYFVWMYALSPAKTVSIKVWAVPILGVLALILVWMLSTHETAKTLYFSMATFHVYVEILGLGFASYKVAQTHRSQIAEQRDDESSFQLQLKHES